MKCLRVFAILKSLNRFVALIFFVFYSLSSQGALKAYLSYSTFMSPQSESYFETYLTVIGQSIIYKKNSNGKFQGIVEVHLLFKQNDSIKSFQKYNLHSQEVDDTIKSRLNFIDVQRFALPNGTYDFELQISDKNNNTAPFKWKETVTIDYSSKKIIVSDIELLESYSKSTKESMLTKNGYDLVPYVSEFYPENFNRLAFYCEIYNTKTSLVKDEKFVISYFIQSAEGKNTMSDFAGFSTQKANSVNILLSSFQINSLPSGNYYLVVEVKDKNNSLLASKKRFFQRKNPVAKIKVEDLSSLNVTNSFAGQITNKDTLLDYIKSLRPIATTSEKSFIDDNALTSEITLLQQFFYNFWDTRSSKQPEQEWLRYKADVVKVNATFSSHPLKGYDTDRGRVYLQYGPPDNRSVNEYGGSNLTNIGNEQGAVVLNTPGSYEVWQYFKLQNQTNRRFVFVNSDFASNNYKLIHSDARGEFYNSNFVNASQNTTISNSDYGDRIFQDYLNSK